MSSGLSVATEIVLTAEVHIALFQLQPKFCSKSTLHDTTDPMQLFLVHTVVFIGSIWKNMSENQKIMNCHYYAHQDPFLCSLFALIMHAKNHEDRHS
jgi:hypothetical protein